MAEAPKPTSPKITVHKSAETQGGSLEVFAKSGYPATAKETIKMTLNFLLNFIS